MVRLPLGHSDIGILMRGILESTGLKNAQFGFLSVIRLMFPVQALLFLFSKIATTCNITIIVTLI